METRELTCIVCPVGCRVTVEVDGEEMRITGNGCKRGETYCRQEVTCPVRTVTSLVAVEGGEHPLCPVKTARPVPREKVPEVLAALRALRVSAPIAIGDVLAEDVAGTGVALVATDDRAASAQTAAC
ncbi:MAG TPA: DUF1667 domain-containing protein [Candidatus Pullichristensenella stercoripullorum]|nr:DUF1667 domain-containing protein [Candidatus Pullichristensenella stercoripullorum]